MIEGTILVCPAAPDAERDIRDAWVRYQETEYRGTELGKVLYEWREKFSARGKTGQGLRPMLDKVGIPKSTAYYWIGRYEESIGLRRKEGASPLEPTDKDLNPPPFSPDWMRRVPAFVNPEQLVELRRLEELVNPDPGAPEYRNDKIGILKIDPLYSLVDDLICRDYFERGMQRSTWRSLPKSCASWR